MGRYDVKITGVITVEASSHDEALDKVIETNYQIADLEDKMLLIEGEDNAI